MALVLGVLSCDRDGLTPGPELADNQFYLNYDGSNADAPQLPGGGFYEAAVRFSDAEMADLSGDQLIGVTYWIEEEPQSASLRIYRGGDDQGPGQLLYEADITDQLRRRRWLEHAITDPVALTDDPLWIAIRFSHDSDQRSLGCDEGPAAEGGDWLYDSFDDNWIPLVERSDGSININWNLRGIAVTP